MVLIYEHLGSSRDAHNTLDARRRERGDKREEANRSYHAHCGGRYDSGEDRSPSPNPPGP
jgi:hypothetical protein